MASSTLVLPLPLLPTRMLRPGDSARLAVLNVAKVAELEFDQGHD